MNVVKILKVGEERQADLRPRQFNIAHDLLQDLDGACAAFATIVQIHYAIRTDGSNRPCTVRRLGLGPSQHHKFNCLAPRSLRVP